MPKTRVVKEACSLEVKESLKMPDADDALTELKEAPGGAHGEMSQLKEASVDAKHDNLSEDEDSLGADLFDKDIVLDTGETRALTNSDIRKQCTTSIDEIFQGNVMAVPAFIDSLIAFFAKDLPDPKNKQLYAAHMGAKVSYLLKYTWERGNSTAQTCITSSIGQVDTVQGAYDQVELFVIGVLAAIGPCRGVWVGRFANKVAVSWPLLIGVNFAKYIQTGTLVLILMSSFSSFMVEAMQFCLEFMLGIEKEGIINNRRALIKYGGAWCVVSFGNLCPELSIAAVLAVVLM
tara:strand:- start:1413 stop:2285 length:873 start_codon:yes stop_codon:yes gene_type:complete